ncbi:unnamed protein product [Mytilus coruscus]|uniref:Ig-like domain-containing protein n=1 Tax=Mytilus coruscus TaxID=42192 RepID=A0A6J8E4R3_MYTCO|nr:unnamed protein product [Mytilus coruscus]
MILSQTAHFQQDKLKFGCILSNVPMWGGVTHIILSKNTSTGFQDIVSVNLNFLKNQTIWKQSKWHNRATVIKEYVNPLTTSTGLEFDIHADNVLCSDEGTYRCTVIGTSAFNQPKEIDRIGTVQIKVEPTTIDQIQVSPKPEIEELYKPNTLIELSCTGTVGSNPAGELRWCYRRDDMFYSIGWPNADDYDRGMLIPQVCQNIRTSILRYNVSSDYKYTEFRCESGDSFLPCGSSRTIASNITIYKYSVPIQSTTSTSIETTDSVSLQSTSLTTAETVDESVQSDGVKMWNMFCFQVSNVTTVHFFNVCKN